LQFSAIGFHVDGSHGSLEGVGGGEFLAGDEKEGGGDVFVRGGDSFVEAFGGGGGDGVGEGEVGGGGGRLGVDADWEEGEEVL